MRNLLLVALLSSFVALPVQAQVYKWKDAQGRTVISDTPQPGAGKQAPAVKTAPATSSDAASEASEAPKSWAEKDMEFRKRQQEQQEAAAKAAKEKEKADIAKDNCDRSRQRLAMLESGQRVARTKVDGEREFLDDSQREKELAQARRGVSEWCK